MDPELCLDPELGKFKVGSGKNHFWIRKKSFLDPQR